MQLVNMPIHGLAAFKEVPNQIISGLQVVVKFLLSILKKLTDMHLMLLLITLKISLILIFLLFRVVLRELKLVELCALIML